MDSCTLVKLQNDAWTGRQRTWSGRWDNPVMCNWDPRSRNKQQSKIGVSWGPKEKEWVSARPRGAQVQREGRGGTGVLLKPGTLIKMSETVYPSSPGLVANSAGCANVSLLGTTRTLLNSEAFSSLLLASFHSSITGTPGISHIYVMAAIFFLNSKPLGFSMSWWSPQPTMNLSSHWEDKVGCSG